MKSYFFVATLLLVSNITILNAQAYKDQMVMCSNSELVVAGRCTGSANCKVCKDCSRCGYCNSGGACGVCSSGRRASSRAYSLNRGNYTTRTSTTNPDDLMADQPNSKYYLKTLYVVNTDNLNLRAGPGTRYRIITSLKRNTKLYFWAMNDNWVKVTVQSSQIVGYVYIDYVAVD